MPHYHELSLKKVQNYSISKTGKEKNKHASHDEDMLPSKKELIAQIDANLRHLQGQKKILQNAKDGKTWKQTFLTNDNKNIGTSIDKRNINSCRPLSNHPMTKSFEHKSVKVNDCYTQIGDSLHQINSNKNYKVSTTNLQKCTTKNSSFRQNVHSTSECSLHGDYKVCKNKSITKVNSKTHINVFKIYRKRPFIHKEKDLSIEKTSSEFCQPFQRLESKACGKSKCLTKLEVKSKPRETSVESHAKTNKIISLSSRNDLQTDKKENISESVRSSQKSSRTLYRTESSIRRHAKLSKEIIDYVNQRKNHRSLPETNKEKHSKKKHILDKLVFHRSLRLQSPKEENKKVSEVSKPSEKSNISEKRTNFKQNVSIYNHDTFIIVNSDGKMSQKKETNRGDDNELGRYKAKKLTDTSISSKSHSVDFKNPNVIDDSTYVLPENSEENEYLLIPYTPHTSGANFNLNIPPKSEREHKTNKVGKEIPSEIQKPSEPSLSSENEIPRPYKSLQPPQKTISNNDKLEKRSSHRSDDSEYMSHNLETTWDSHGNCQAQYTSRFVTSHNNRIKVPTDYRPNYFELKDQPEVQTFSNTSAQKKTKRHSLPSSLSSSDVPLRSVSKPLRSDKYEEKSRFCDYKSTEQSSQTEHPNHREMGLKDLSVCITHNRSGNNITITSQREKMIVKDNLLEINSKNTTDPAITDSVPNQLWQNEKHSELTQFKFEQHSHVASNKISHTNSEAKQKEEFQNSVRKTTSQLMREQDPKLGIPNKIEVDVCERDSKPNEILTKKEHFEIIASSIESTSNVSWTPRQKLTYSENELLDQVLKETRQNYDSNLKSFSLQSVPLLKRNAFQNKLMESRYQHDECERSLPRNDLRPPQVFEKLVLAPSPNASMLSDISAISVNENGKDLVHKSLPDQKKGYEKEKFSQKLPKSESQINVSTGDMNLEFEPEPTSQGNQSVSEKVGLNRPLNHSFSITDQRKEYETQGIPQSEQNPNASTDPISLTHEPNEAHDLNSRSSRVEEVEISPSSHRGLESGIHPRMSPNEKSRLLGCCCMSFSSQSVQANKNESQNNLQKSDGSISLKHKLEEDNQSDEQKNGSNGSVQSTFNDLHGANEINQDLKSLSNKSSLSISTTLENFKAKKLSQSSVKSYTESNHSTGRTSFKLETLSLNNLLTIDGKSETNTDTSFGSIVSDPHKMKESDRNSKSNDIEEPKSPSKQPSSSSGSQYFEFENENVTLKTSSRISLTKVKPNSNSSRVSKSLYDFNKNDQVTIRQARSSTLTNTFTHTTSDTSSRSKISLRSEKLPFVKLKSSNNQTENILDENSCQNSSSSSSRNVENEENVFLSDTFNQTALIEGVPPDVSDLIQHLQNRVRDCDENVKKQFKEFEKLKKCCKIVEPSTSGASDRKNDEKNISRETRAEEHIENMANNEQKELNSSENDIEEENSCHSIFSGQGQSISISSEEIPPFTGCDCMKEDYYKIMRIAYNK